MVKLTLITILMLGAFTSCEDNGIEVMEKYREERISFSQGLDKTEALNAYTLPKELEAQLQLLSKSQKQHLLNEEISTLKSTAILGVGPSGMAVLRDSLNKPKYKCGAIDYSLKSVAKIFETKEFFYNCAFPQTYYIPLRWYVINQFKDSIKITEKDLKAQVDILNDAFDSTSIQFFNYSSEWRTNLEWCKALMGSTSYYEMVEYLAEDPSTAINIFVTSQDSLLGSAPYPWDLDRYKTIYDNILLKETTFYGGIEDANVMLGKTLIHEMGHFFGLFHTFHMEMHDENDNPVNIECNANIHNGCGELITIPRIGDGITDTPPQKICHNYGCGLCKHGESIDNCDNCGYENEPLVKICDTCPNLDGLDPVKNYMGYNPDNCIDHFTGEQYLVLKRNFMIYRRYLNSDPIKLNESITAIQQ